MPASLAPFHLLLSVLWVSFWWFWTDQRSLISGAKLFTCFWADNNTDFRVRPLSWFVQCSIKVESLTTKKWAQSPKRGQLVLTPDTYFSAESVWWSKLHWWWESRRPAALSSLAWRQWGPHTVTPRLSSHISLKKMKELIHRGWSLSASQANSGCQKNWILFYPQHTISKSTLRMTSVHFTCDFFCPLAYFLTTVGLSAQGW